MNLVETRDGLLKATDICDRCNSRAYVQAFFPSGTELKFCGHHWEQFKDKVQVAAVGIIDETALID